MMRTMISLPDVQKLGGTLGSICRERAIDYANASLEIPAGGTAFHGGRFEEALRQQALRGNGRVKLIAELKRSSPRGAIQPGLDALETARAYAEGGASALSVLTEPRHFQGSLDDLRIISSQQSLPTLRKDFVVHPAQIVEAKDAGASAILLLVNVLGNLTRDYLTLAHACGLDALVEVHTEEELEIALLAGSRILGVNNRDLVTLEINTGTAPRIGMLARQDDFEGVLIALSGYSNRAELISLEGLFDAVLVGSSLAGAGNSEQITAATRALLVR
jgi:indole-3-glycerol phosphate synthase